MNQLLDTRALLRFWAFMDRPSPTACWTWGGAATLGYGRFWLNGRLTLAHRVSYELHRGDIPPGLVIDHICRNRGCVNPAHLQPLTSGQNVLLGAGITATNARKTQCLKGHGLSGENLYVTPRGHRHCIECQRERVRLWRQRKAEAA